MSRDQRIGTILVLLSTVGYALLPIIARNLYAISELSPVDIALWRFIFAMPLIWILINARIRRTGMRGPVEVPRIPIIVMGILYAGSALTVFAGVELIPASIYVVFFFTYPVFVTLFSRLMGTRLRPLTWLALGLTVIGLFLTIPDFSALHGSNLLGIVIAIINAVLVAIYFLMSARVLRAPGAVARGTAQVITITLICLLTLAPFFGLTISDDPVVWLHLVAMGLFGTVMPMTLINAGIQRIGAPMASIVSAIEPGIAALLAMFLLGEVVLPTQWLGILCVTAAVIMVQLPRSKLKWGKVSVKN